MKISLKKRDEELIENIVLGVFTTGAVCAVIIVFIMFLQFKILANIYENQCPTTQIQIVDDVKEFQIEGVLSGDSTKYSGNSK